jgi:hypothetical protein
MNLMPILLRPIVSWLAGRVVTERAIEPAPPAISEQAKMVEAVR